MYKDGDIVTDIVIKETFTWNQEIDGWVGRNKPQQLRFANQNEKNNLIKRDVTFYYYRTPHPQ
tara:strand:- start:217 stop:405 length:189 start_codon:yes stop_codon:yes gene_type:complete